MNQPLLKDSSLDLSWLQQTSKNNPCAELLGADGKPTGNFITGPVRLSFPNLFKPRERSDGSLKYDVKLLFGPYTDLKPLTDCVNGLAAENFPNRSAGLKFPFSDQGATMATGMNPGHVAANASSGKQVAVVDSRKNLIVDEKKVYPGVWALAVVRPFPYTHSLSKGISLGLQSLMIIADDDNLAGGGVDPQVAFASANVVPPAGADMSAMFSSAPPAMAQPPMAQPPMAQPPMAQPPMAQPPMAQPPQTSAGVADDEIPF